ncbi:unnamed protein product [Caenorhabditis angaria]|uniref:Major facilitator superfamily (MFS) profile domain-containing protein n=1 Tax=Caenorhabditis angaria TaxID=860376 RepID=A0A9P1IFY1_9PELO|nr:unnamed protein product [Caenorhabditis angaria]
MEPAEAEITAREEEFENGAVYPPRKKKAIATMILLLVNLLNYIDRFTIVGVMDRLKVEFEMNEKDSGMLQHFETKYDGFLMILTKIGPSPLLI